MPRSSTAFRQIDIARALKGAQTAGFNPTRVEIDGEGRIVVDFRDNPVKDAKTDCDKYWDEKRHARSA